MEQSSSKKMMSIVLIAAGIAGVVGALIMDISKSSSSFRGPLLIIGAVLFFVGLFLFVKAVDGNWFGWFGDSPKSELLDKPVQVEASEIYSADGKLIGKFFTENRSLVEFDDISPLLIETLIHTEDERFYDHHGVDYMGILGAFKDALFGNARGASTISQQLVKNLFKIREEYRGKVAPGMVSIHVRRGDDAADRHLQDAETQPSLRRI